MLKTPAQRRNAFKDAEDRAVAEADHFIVTRRLARGRYERIRCDTLGEAEALGTGDHRRLIYCIRADGTDWPLRTI